MTSTPPSPPSSPEVVTAATTPATHPNQHFYKSNEDWCSLYDPNGYLFDEGFVHDNPLVVSFSTEGKTGKFYAEETISLVQERNRKAKYLLADNVNLLIGLSNRRSIWLKFLSK